MKTIKIKWLWDTSECDDCGINYADGAEFQIEQNPLIVMKPIAHCYDGVTFEDRDVFERILLELGYKVEYV